MTNLRCSVHCPQKGTIYEHGAYWCEHHAPSRWNAREKVRAAAPELLEALEESTDGLRDFLAVQTFREGNFEQYIPTINFLISANEAAIAKAKGKKK